MQAETETTVYTIRTEQFEGPLDVLLNLIEKRKLLINQITLGEVTEEFIQFANRLDGQRALREKAGFVAIASILLLIKAKSLLPVLEITPEEEVDIADLEKRLKILEFMRVAAKKLGIVYGKTPIYEQGNFRREIRIFAPSQDIHLTSIADAVRSVLSSLPKKEVELPKIRVRKVMSLEEMMERLSTRIHTAMKMTFTTFSKAPDMELPPNATIEEIIEVKKASKQHVVVSFLALLELVKQNMLIAEQAENFAEIAIENLPTQKTSQETITTEELDM